jgi:hypothetical protein
VECVAYCTTLPNSDAINVSSAIRPPRRCRLPLRSLCWPPQSPSHQRRPLASPVRTILHLRYYHGFLPLRHRLVSPWTNYQWFTSRSGTQGIRGAVLSLPVTARREDTLVKSAFWEWIVKHVDRCFAFSQDFQQGIKQLEDIILVTGCDRTSLD